MQSSKASCVLLILSCVAGMVLAQTFQYSRGWTNGRKRSGMVSVEEPTACQLQRLRLLLQGHNSPQLYLPCEMWKSFSSSENSLADDVSEKTKRRSSFIEMVPAIKNVNDAEEI